MTCIVVESFFSDKYYFPKGTVVKVTKHTNSWVIQVKQFPLKSEFEEQGKNDIESLKALAPLTHYITAAPDSYINNLSEPIFYEEEEIKYKSFEFTLQKQEKNRIFLSCEYDVVFEILPPFVDEEAVNTKTAEFYISFTDKPGKAWKISFINDIKCLEIELPVGDLTTHIIADSLTYFLHNELLTGYCSRLNSNIINSFINNENIESPLHSEDEEDEEDDEWDD